MALKVIKPTTPGRRGMTILSSPEITTKKPLKSLLKPHKKTGGRNHRGVITTRRRGGGAKRRYRMVNWKLPEGFKGVVREIEYDPNRSAHLARLEDENGKFHYILALQKMKVGQKISSDLKTQIESGNRLQLRHIPIGSLIHNLSLKINGPAQIVRAAGLSAQLTAKDSKYAHIKLPSGEIRLFHLDNQATLGVIGNEQHQNVKLGKAGRRRHQGRRPKVRGVAMNAADHPHGGGEGKSKGYKTPQTPWGTPTLGYKTRHKRRQNRFILKSRHLAKKRKRKG